MHAVVRHTLAAVAALAAASPLAAAGDLTKDQCLDAHSRGQDARAQGKLSLARKLFLTCAQSSCPALVQDDCARFADDLGRLQPTVSFVARDASGADLPDTAVYVDDVLIVTRLDDGKAHDLDPGKHVVRFANRGREQTVTIVIGVGEQGRTISTTFATPSRAVIRAPLPAPRRAPTDSLERPGAPRYLIWGGAGAFVGGAALGVFGLSRIPASCDYATRQCAAPPGDPSFDAASSAVRLANDGWLIAGVGAAALTIGVVWYYAGSTPSKERMALAPWVNPHGGGLVLSGPL